MSETDKYRHLTVQYCQGNGVDIGSQGDPVVPWAIQVELPPEQFRMYAGYDQPNTVEWKGTGEQLPFKDNVLDFVYSSHWLEDVQIWEPVLIEWIRTLKKGGRLVVVVPDKQRWTEAVQRGQPPNYNHKHEGFSGELTWRCSPFGLKTIEDRLTGLNPQDYSILYVGVKQ